MLFSLDFDKKIVELFEEAYRNEHQTELIQDEQDRAKYEDEAEDVKKTLNNYVEIEKFVIKTKEDVEKWKTFGSPKLAPKSISPWFN